MSSNLRQRVVQEEDEQAECHVHVHPIVQALARRTICILEVHGDEGQFSGSGSPARAARQERVYAASRGVLRMRGNNACCVGVLNPRDRA